MKRYQLRIDGKSVDPLSSLWFESHNPYTGEPWAEIPRGDAHDVEHAVGARPSAFTEGPWGQMTASQRGMLLHRLGDLIARDASKLAETGVRRQRRAVRRMSAQLDCIAQWFYYSGGLADKIQGATCRSTRKDTSASRETSR